MSDYNNLIILGYSGHSYVVIDAAKSMGVETIAYCEISEAKRNPYNLKYAGNENTIQNSDIPKLTYFFPAVGDNVIRKKLSNHIELMAWKEINVLHNTANISEKAELSSLVLVAPMAVINSMAKIGRGCIINTSAVVEHECEIGNYTHIGPRAVLLGAVKTGESCLIGAGSVIMPGVEIGDNVVIGAGSVVLKNIPSGETWVGNPAHKIK